MTTLSTISSFSCSLSSPFCFITDLHTLGSVTHSIHVGSRPNLSLKGRQSWGGSKRRSVPDFLCTPHQFSGVHCQTSTPCTCFILPQTSPQDVAQKLHDVKANVPHVHPVTPLGQFVGRLFGTSLDHVQT